MRLLSALVFSVWCPVAALAQNAGDVVGPLIGSFAAGIFCAPEVVGTNAAPDTVAGVTNIIVGEPNFVSTGRTVPAVPGMGFGVKSRAKSAPLTFVTVVITHPPMGGGRVTSQSYTTNIGSEGSSLTMYQFDFDYELVEGPWSITAFDDDETLFRARFTVVSPQLVPELAGVCGYEDLLG